nr:glycoside hydrolase family 16 protein [Galbitalea soli]
MPAPAPLHLLWSDDFSGAAGAPPDRASWVAETGGAGWGNHELECYTRVPGNAATDGAGHLVITALHQPGHVCSDGSRNDYTSARLTTEGRVTAGYGRLEVRAQVPTTPGVWPAFWALGDDLRRVDWPAAGEIDVMEVGGNRPRTVFGTLHGPAADGSAYQHGVTHDSAAPLSGGFHVYAASWSPGSVSFSIDGRRYGTVTRAEVVGAGGRWVFSHRVFLILDLAIGGDFPGPVSPATRTPQRFVVDYVRVYG